MVNQHIGNHGLGIFWCGQILPWIHPSWSISLTMPDREISSKFSTHRVSEQCSLCNFQNIFPSPKMAAILNFRIFAKKWQNTNFLLSP